MATKTLSASIDLKTLDNVIGIFGLDSVKSQSLSYDDTNVSSASTALTTSYVEYILAAVAKVTYVYIKNLDTTAGNRIFIYDDTTSGDPLQFQLDAGDWGFIPMHGDKTYKAYATTNPTSIEFMVMGKDQ